MIAILLSSQCDSIVTKTCDALIPVVQKTYEAGTNCCDVMIIGIICATIVILALIAKCAILSWKGKEIAADKQEREFKKDKEKEECDRKQKAEFLDKYLDYLKEKGFQSNANAENDYQRVLANLIVKSQQNKMDEISPEELINDLNVNTSSNSTQTNKDL